MLRVLVWEWGKLVRLRAVRLGLAVALLLPVLWVLAPLEGQAAVYGVVLASGWQLPAVSLFSGMTFLFPLLVAMASAEVVGSEITLGTFKSLLVRPFPRWGIMLAKLWVVLGYPIMLLALSLVGSLVVGLFLGLGPFYGGTGLSEGGFVGSGLLQPEQALNELVRAHALAVLVLWPIATLAFLASVVTLSSTGGTLIAIAAIQLLQVLRPFQFDWLQRLLLTNHLNLYTQPTSEGLLVLLVHTTVFATLALMVFERKEV